jgi:hypothetical protein
MIISPSNAQSLSSHRWKDRVLVIYSTDSSNSTLLNQIKELKKDEKGLHDRKIVIYQSINGKVKQGMTENGNLEVIEFEGLKRRKPSSEFEIQLIGLDGGVKLTKIELLTSKELFGTIDQMPMRISEMKRRKDN